MQYKHISNNATSSQLLVGTTRPMTKLDQILNFLSLNKIMARKKIISVLSLNGMIAKTTTYRSHFNFEGINDLIEKAFENPRTSAVCLVINSPGGSPVQTELIAKRIKALSIKKKIPVYSFVEDIAASGGYWLACAGEEIYASKSSIIGSIGVISAGFGLQNAIHKLGIERRVYTIGKNKSILDPFQPEKEEDIKIIMHLQEQVHKHFIDYVKSSRGNRLTQDDEILFNGEFWAGATALDFGLIDGIDDMYSFINKKFGDDVKIEYIAQKRSWLKNKLGINSDSFIEKLINVFLDKVENKIENSRYDLK